MVQCKKCDRKNIELLHEQIFFEDTQGGNIGFMGDNTLKEDDPGLYNPRHCRGGYNDALLREAIKTTQPLRKYRFTHYNCQDWIDEVLDRYRLFNLEYTVYSDFDMG